MQLRVDSGDEAVPGDNAGAESESGVRGAGKSLSSLILTPGKRCEEQTKGSAEDSAVGTMKFVPFTCPVLTAHGPPSSLQTRGKPRMSR